MRESIIEGQSSLEGKKWFTIYHSTNYIKQNLCKDFEIVFYEEASKTFYGQDIWIGREI